MNILEKEFDKYQDFVFKHAIKQFNEHIKPWLTENNFDFVAGNGSYFINESNSDPRIPVWPEDLPEEIEKILEFEIPGMSGNSLGTLMPDHTN